MLENKLIKGIHASRYIASWKNAWGPTKGLRFTDWLRQLDFDGEKLSDDEVEYINNMRMMGKFELEKNAMMYKEKFGKS